MTEFPKAKGRWGYSMGIVQYLVCLFEMTFHGYKYERDGVTNYDFANNSA